MPLKTGNFESEEWYSERGRPSLYVLSPSVHLLRPTSTYILPIRISIASSRCLLLPIRISITSNRCLLLPIRIYPHTYYVLPAYQVLQKVSTACDVIYQHNTHPPYRAHSSKGIAMDWFKGKTVIVTGGGRAVLKDGNPGSIGYGIDRAFAKEGANLVITGRNEAKLQAAKQELEAEFGIEVLPVVADVTAGEDNEATVQRVVDAAIEKFGRIDALVNNAQASASGVTLAEHTMEQFNLAIYSGLYAAYLYMQKCYPYLKETKGSVVNFASGAGLFGNYGQCSYAAAKEGIRGLTRVAATEWGPDGINVNIVCPLAWTAALENFKDTYPEAYEANVHMPPMGHYGNVEHEIGRVVVQLCSPDFKFMSGETVTLEGGLGLRP